MRRLGATSGSELIAIAEDRARSVEDRRAACSALGALRYRDAVPAMMRLAAADDDADVHWEALNTLGFIGSGRATRFLMRMARDNKDGLRRLGAVYALRFLGDRRADGTLISILKNEGEEERSRGCAAEALGPRPRAVAALIDAFESPSVEVRFSALCAMTGGWCPPDLEPARRLLDDDAVGDECDGGRETVGDLAREVVETIEQRLAEGLGSTQRGPTGSSSLPESPPG